MDRSIPPRPLHRLHPAITRAPRSKRLALTSPRRPLQHDDRRPIPRLHKPPNLPTTTLPLDLRRIPRRPNRRRKNQTRLPSRHDGLPLNPRSTRTRSPRNLPERQSLSTLQSSASTTRLLHHKRHDWTRSRRHHPAPHTRRISNKPDGHSRHCSDHDQKRWPRLRRRHDIRSSSLPLLARRRVRPQDFLGNDQDKETHISTEHKHRQHTKERNPPTRTRNPPTHPELSHRSPVTDNSGSTKRTLSAKPCHRTRHARSTQCQPTNDKPRPLKQRTRSRQQLRRKQPLNLRHRQQLLAIPRRQLGPRNPKLHPRTILTTSPHHILHRRPRRSSRRIRQCGNAVLSSPRCPLHQSLRPSLRARNNHDLRAKPRAHKQRRTHKSARPPTQLKLLNPHQTSRPSKPPLLRCNRPRNNKPPTSTQQDTNTSLQLLPQHPVSTRILQGRTTLSQPENTPWIPNRNRGRYQLKRIHCLHFLSTRNSALQLAWPDTALQSNLQQLHFNIRLRRHHYTESRLRGELHLSFRPKHNLTENRDPLERIPRNQSQYRCHDSELRQRHRHQPQRHRQPGTIRVSEDPPDIANRRANRPVRQLPSRPNPIPQLHSNNAKQRHLRSFTSVCRLCLASAKWNKDTIHSYHRRAPCLIVKRTLDAVYTDLHRPPALLLSSPTSPSTHTDH